MTIKTLKLYIEPASLPLTYELIDYVNNIADDSVYSILLFQRLTINLQGIQNGRTVFIDNVNNGLNQKLESLSNFIIGKPGVTIEIHTNIYRQYDILIPLLKKITPEVPLEKVNLHLYEDGTGTILQLLNISRIDERILVKSIQERASSLQEYILSNEPTTQRKWHYIDNYLWHYFISAKYYLIPSGMQQNTNNKFISKLNNHVIPMVFNEKTITTILLPEVWNHLFNVPINLVEKLKKLSADNEAFLFLTSYYPNRTFKAVHHKSLIDTILTLKEKGELPRSNKIIFKGHPENFELNKEICHAIGSEITIIPEGAPMEYFETIGALPKKIGGHISSSMFSLKNKDIKFVIFNGSENDTTNHPMHDLNEYCSCFANEKIIYLDEKNKYLEVNRENDKRSSRIFYSSASMGDIIYGIAAINALRQHYPHDRFIFVTNKLYSELITKCPSDIEFWDIDRLNITQQIELQVANDCSRLHFFEKWEQVVSKMHMTDAFINDVIDEDHSTNKNPLITLNKLDKNPVDDFLSDNKLIEKKIVLLHTNIGSPNRTWPLENWAELAKYFITSGWEVILIGSDNNKDNNKKASAIDVDGIYNAINLFSISQTIYLMSQCQLLVSCDSGPVALAGYTEIAISSLYSIIPAERRLPYRNGVKGWNAQGINIGCKYGQCGELIMDEKFHKNILLQKWSSPNSKKFANWCPNKNKYSCLNKFTPMDWWAQISKFIESENFVLNKQKRINTPLKTVL